MLFLPSCLAGFLDIDGRSRAACNFRVAILGAPLMHQSGHLSFRHHTRPANPLHSVNIGDSTTSLSPLPFRHAAMSQFVSVLSSFHGVFECSAFWVVTGLGRVLERDSITGKTYHVLYEAALEDWGLCSVVLNLVWI